jgi:hypothetical protein
MTHVAVAKDDVVDLEPAHECGELLLRKDLQPLRI